MVHFGGRAPVGPPVGEPASLWVAPRGGGLFRRALRGRRGSSVVSWGFFGPSVVFLRLPESFGASVGLLGPAGACWGLAGACWGLLCPGARWGLLGPGGACWGLLGASWGLLALFRASLIIPLSFVFGVGGHFAPVPFWQELPKAKLRRMALVSSLIFFCKACLLFCFIGLLGVWRFLGPLGASGVSWSLCGLLGLLGASWGFLRCLGASWGFWGPLVAF